MASLTPAQLGRQLPSPEPPQFPLTTPRMNPSETAASSTETTSECSNSINSHKKTRIRVREITDEQSQTSLPPKEKWRARTFFHQCVRHWVITGSAILSVILLALTIALALHFTIGRRKDRDAPTSSGYSVTVSSIAPSKNDFPPIGQAFVSFAIEFAFFPDFAGNNSAPNTFSDNLLNNIGNLTGTKPYIRVGGDSQDYAIFNSSLPVAIHGVYNYSHTQNYPTTVTMGPSFFESYSTWPNTKFIHGFNMGLATTPAGWESLLQTIPLACSALESGNLLWWEYGNEPDLYPTSPARVLRTGAWNYSIYLDQWKNGTAAIEAGIKTSCPNLTSTEEYGYVGPSYAYRGLDPSATFASGLNENGTIKQITMHHYMGDTRDPGISLQNKLMNHTSVALTLGSQLRNEAIDLSNATLVNPLAPTQQIPMVLNEANSLTSNTFGPKDMLDVFGNALWTLDYMLYCATLGFSRVHMQLGTDFRYSSWQPVTTANMTKGTLPPYYGNVAVAAMLGNVSAAAPQIVNLALEHDLEAAYAAYTNGTLARVALINLKQWNVSMSGNNTARPNRTYTLDLGLKNGREVKVQRLLAAGSDAKRGISWDGWSYEMDLDEGRPVRLPNVTVGEVLKARNGSVEVVVPDSSAVILTF
ncbi:hypothetical protein BP6252_03683 [Coleophoma cylindrospora]|uniref:Beta-glucuronidase C-terminal domain-containing protein n=1 Tax=Coleophoma cylindrospora TaxID=1849047 RepID=A0A3D8S8U7_9HELO|nr:hypothetical protein BP6252_03683 [Coleophoma cylindrospora]